MRQRICDGVKDCRDGSDERHCARRLRTTTPYFMESSTYGHSPSYESSSNNPSQNEIYSTIYESVQSDLRDQDDISTEVIDEVSQDSYTIFDNPSEKTQSTSKHTSTSFQETDNTISTDAEHSTQRYPDFPINLLTPYKSNFKGIEAMSLTREENTKDVRYMTSNTAAIASPPEVNVRVYPEQQTLTEGQDAIIQCRDEGVTRTPVIWRRVDNKPLPRRSKEVCVTFCCRPCKQISNNSHWISISGSRKIRDIFGDRAGRRRLYLCVNKIRYAILKADFCTYLYYRLNLPVNNPSLYPRIFFWRISGGKHQS